jgi:molecular chaperone GrpE (heat shock protein)
LTEAIEQLADRLETKITDFQQEILNLNTALDQHKRESRESNNALFREIFEVLDTFELVFERLAPERAGLNKKVDRCLKSIESTNRKLERMLTERGVAKIEFPDNKIIIGQCRIVDTVADPQAANGTIVTIVRHGYISGTGDVLRLAEVISVRN